jgi:calcium/calmodulin-dependent protein kinase I
MICIPIFYIHKLGVIHRDLKPGNILWKKVGIEKVYAIADFGFSKFRDQKNVTSINTGCTPEYACKE